MSVLPLPRRGHFTPSNASFKSECFIYLFCLEDLLRLFDLLLGGDSVAVDSLVGSTMVGSIYILTVEPVSSEPVSSVPDGLLGLEVDDLEPDPLSPVEPLKLDDLDDLPDESEADLVLPGESLESDDLSKGSEMAPLLLVDPFESDEPVFELEPGKVSLLVLAPFVDELVLGTVSDVLAPSPSVVLGGEQLVPTQPLLSLI